MHILYIIQNQARHDWLEYKALSRESRELFKELRRHVPSGKNKK